MSTAFGILSGRLPLLAEALDRGNVGEGDDDPRDLRAERPVGHYPDEVPVVVPALYLFLIGCKVSSTRPASATRSSSSKFADGVGEGTAHVGGDEVDHLALFSEVKRRRCS